MKRKVMVWFVKNVIWRLQPERACWLSIRRVNGGIPDKGEDGWIELLLKSTHGRAAGMRIPVEYVRKAHDPLFAKLEATLNTALIAGGRLFDGQGLET